ncbi:MAG: hypothetical protein WC026_17145 [Hyphomicrobium sp.]|uniref:hypothetical protein n=1 Tax=Hyphomicrobium sp. TaxID=82 RepID=UPI00356202A6
MSIPESVVEAASILQPTAEVRARAVINALADHLPESAVDAHLRAYWLLPPGLDIEMLFGSTVRLTNERARSRAAIIAVLKDGNYIH